MHASGQYVLRVRAGSHDKWNVLKDGIFVCPYRHWVPWTELLPAWMVMRGVKRGERLGPEIVFNTYNLFLFPSSDFVRPWPDHVSTRQKGKIHESGTLL
jgi:hypothetical protein